MTLNETEEIERELRQLSRGPTLALARQAAEAIAYLLKELAEAETYGYIRGFDQ